MQGQRSQNVQECSKKLLTEKKSETLCKYYDNLLHRYTYSTCPKYKFYLISSVTFKNSSKKLSRLYPRIEKVILCQVFKAI